MKPRRRPTQSQVEQAWRIRLLSRGVTLPDATEAERRAAAKRVQDAQQQQDEQENGA